MSDERKKQLEAFAKQLQGGNPLAEDFVKSDRSVLSQSLQARNLAEDTLANEVLKNTGVPIPGKGSSISKNEDFLNRILSERYPELSPDVRMSDLGQNDGMYNAGKIGVHKKFSDDPIKAVSGLLHEGGHQYDDKILNFDGSDNIKLKDLKQNVPKGRMLQDIDPMQMSEIINKGHHARIPSLRDSDSYGLGALKSMLKSGTFKQVAGALPLVGGLATAAISGDASAAVPLLDEADDVGESAEDEKAMLNEHKARVNYDKSPAGKNAQENQQFRQRALKTILHR